GSLELQMESRSEPGNRRRRFCRGCGGSVRERLPPVRGAQPTAMVQARLASPRARAHRRRAGSLARQMATTASAVEVLAHFARLPSGVAAGAVLVAGSVSPGSATEAGVAAGASA